MRRKNFAVFLTMIYILLMINNVIIPNKGIKVDPSDYTHNATVNSEITIEVDYLLFNSVPIVTPDVLNVINLLNLDIESSIGEISDGIIIKNVITDINTSHIVFQKGINVEDESAVDLSGAFSETQSLDDFSITNTIMTSNETLIEENIEKLNIGDYTSYEEDEIRFYNETVVDGIYYSITSTYHLETGWLKDLVLFMENDTDGTELFIVDFHATSISYSSDISRGDITVPVDQDYFTTGLIVGDKLLLNLTAYIPEEVLLQLPVGLNVELEIISITYGMITYNVTFIYQNGTRVMSTSPYDCERDEINIGDFIITTNTTLLNNSGIYPSFNITFSEGLVSFLQILKDEKNDFFSIYEYIYSTETGFIERYNVTRANYNRTEIYYHEVFEVISPTNTTSSSTTSETLTNTTLTESTSIEQQSSEISTTTSITTSITTTIQRTTFLFDSFTILTLGILTIFVVNNRRKKK